MSGREILLDPRCGVYRWMGKQAAPTLLYCIPAPGPGHRLGAQEPPLPSTALAAGAGMLLAAPKGGTEVEHPHVSALRGAQSCFFAGGGDGLSQTTELGWKPWIRMHSQLIHQTGGMFNLLHIPALMPCLFSGTLPWGACS